jgi:hypothetical protein
MSWWDFVFNLKVQVNHVKKLNKPREFSIKIFKTISFNFFLFLVSVENIEQFDAARGFLKELDISDNVWIGLMRPTNADQFSWT